ncbi:MAG: DNA mismatch repair endonuclease MutL [Mollicutes bacterium]|nr:DNA mismatch repair endonuclease MutL [Mollicutes bacterium]
MSTIKIMSENLANKIAAGEVIEKCSSVVKELVENSIDAGAKNIKVELIDGGIKQIKVTDDGVGMDESDALMAFSRHATSKVLKEEDLFFIDTLGFRGEALPSIASVSEVTLKTSKGGLGTTIIIKGGKLISKEKSDAYQGTIITIDNIFYNTPARLKFLKSPQTEGTNTINLIEKIALSHPDIKFTLINNDSTLLNTSGSGNLHKTIHEIYGLSISSKMIEIKGLNDDFEIYGYVSRPEVLKNNMNHLITFVNGRYVKNRELNKMINDAYYTHKPDNKYPVCVINIYADQTLLDVNIHPTKQDIKFSKVNELSDLLISSIQKALKKELLVPEIEIKKEIPIIKEEQTNFEFIKREEKEEQVQHELQLDKPGIKELELYPVGLALGTYIIAQNDEGIYLIDQHAAQERINYEKYLNKLKENNKEVTELLIPITIELSTSEFNTLKEHLSILTDMGFDFEEFGINTYKINSHPLWLKTGYEEESIRKIIDLINIKTTDFNQVKFRENVAITLACKLSIKANYNISHEEMESLLNELIQTDNPYNCPHGRPTIIKFTIYELEKMFKRVMN